MHYIQFYILIMIMTSDLETNKHDFLIILVISTNKAENSFQDLVKNYNTRWISDRN